MASFKEDFTEFSINVRQDGVPGSWKPVLRTQTLLPFLSKYIESSKEYRVARGSSYGTSGKQAVAWKDELSES